DNDCRAAEADPLFPSTWVMPAYGSHTTSRVLRRSCGLFDEWQDAPCYGHDLLVVVRDLALDKKDADYAAAQTASLGTPTEGLLAPMRRFGRYYEAVPDNGGNAQQVFGTSPWAGPATGGTLLRDDNREQARALGFMESYVVAEAESGDWSHVHFLGGDGFEVTAITCTCAALAILEDFEAAKLNCLRHRR
ncbi:unnamed protein product, partial [Symbiodinium necroappetens]